MRHSLADKLLSLDARARHRRPQSPASPTLTRGSLWPRIRCTAGARAGASLRSYLSTTHPVVDKILSRGARARRSRSRSSECQRFNHDSPPLVQNRASCITKDPHILICSGTECAGRQERGRARPDGVYYLPRIPRQITYSVGARELVVKGRSCRAAYS